MSIEELEKAHEKIAFDLDHTRLSIKFAIATLESMKPASEFGDYDYEVRNTNSFLDKKIDELKKLL